jgi:hypothetical protein
MVQFNYVQPTEQQKELMQLYRYRFEALYADVSGLESNRALSRALTKLEEASMWLNKSITNNC